MTVNNLLCDDWGWYIDTEKSCQYEKKQYIKLYNDYHYKIIETNSYLYETKNIINRNRNNNITHKNNITNTINTTNTTNTTHIKYIETISAITIISLISYVVSLYII
jgi:hypothetical protein